MTELRQALDRQMSERDFQDVVITYARARGWLVYHTHNSKHSEGGFPDLCLVRAPRVVFIELKREGAQLSRKQEIWLSSLEACDGVESRLARPSDWKQIELMLR